MLKSIACAGVLAIGLASAQAADPVHGEEVFRACIACHGGYAGDLGPSLAGVVGRKAGSLDTYRYSGPMARAGFTWDEARLRAFLRNPQGVVKGTRMPFGGLTDENDINDVIAFLSAHQ